MTQQRVSAAWGRWYSNFAEAKRIRQLTEKAARRWQLAHCGSCVDKWRVLTRERQQCRKLIHKAIGRYKNKEKTNAWSKWREYLFEQDREAYEAEFRAEQERARQARIRGVVKRMQQQRKAAAWGRWSHNYMTAKRIRTLTEKAARRMRLAKAGSAMEQWQRFVEKRSNCRSIMIRAVGRYSNKEKAWGWGRWRAYLYFLAEQRAENILRMSGERVREARIKGVVARMTQQRVSAAWGRWYSNFAEAKRIRQLTEKAARRWQLAHCGSCVDKWRVLTRERQQCRKLIHKAIGRYKNKEKTNAWSKWREYLFEQDREAYEAEFRAEQERARQARIRGVVKRMQQQRKAAAWGRWSHNYVTAKRV